MIEGVKVMGKKVMTAAAENFSSLFFSEDKQKEKKDKPMKKKETKTETIRTAVSVPEGYELRPERKRARLQLLLTETTSKALKERATNEGKSVNELVNEIIETYLKGETKK